MGVDIKVTTQELKGAAENLRSIADRILSLYAGIREEALKFPAQWEGEAQDTHRQRITAVLDDADKAGQELKLRPDRLLSIVGVYEKTEQENVGKTSDLKLDRDVIT